MSDTVFRLYGTTLRSSFPFRFNLERREAEGGFPGPELEFEYLGVSPETEPPGQEVYSGKVMKLFVSGADETLVFPGIAEFRCSEKLIRGRAFAEGLEYLVEICLVGNVLAYWLERRGVLAIHASAVVVDGRAAAFIAGTSRGKTTAACGFVAAGFPLLTDDILPVDVSPGNVTARPGFPQMKLLPRQAAFLGADPGGFGRVHPGFEKLLFPVGGGTGSYCGTSVPLGRVYLLDRDDNEAGPAVRPVAGADALIELVRHSFAAELMDAADRGPGRLSRLAEVARRVPVRRLRVPSGYHRLAEVSDMVVRDMRETSR